MSEMTSDRPMGVYHDMPAAQYHAVNALSASGLRLFAKSAWEYRNRIEITPTRPMLRGTLAHCALLEPDALAKRYAVVPDDAPRRPTAAQWSAAKPNDSSRAAMAWWREWQAESAGREIVSAEDYALCRAQIDAIRAVPELCELLESGHGEVSIFWVDRATRLYCKARIDWLQVVGGSARILELKSTTDESPAGFGRACARMRYELQRAHYVEAVKWGARLEVEDFTFAAVRSSLPCLAVAYDLCDEIVDQAADDYRSLLTAFAECQRSGEWPAYGKGKQFLDYPAYAKRGGEVEVSFEGE